MPKKSWSRAAVAAGRPCDSRTTLSRTERAQALPLRHPPHLLSVSRLTNVARVAVAPEDVERVARLWLSLRAMRREGGATLARRSAQRQPTQRYSARFATLRCSRRPPRTDIRASSPTKSGGPQRSTTGREPAAGRFSGFLLCGSDFTLATGVASPVPPLHAGRDSIPPPDMASAPTLGAAPVVEGSIAAAPVAPTSLQVLGRLGTQWPPAGRCARRVTPCRPRADA